MNLLEQSNQAQLHQMMNDTRPCKNVSFENTTVAGGATQTLLDVTGAGKITTINLVINTTEYYCAYTSRIKIYVDDNVNAVVDMPIQDFFFNRGFAWDAGDGTRWQSDRIGSSKNYNNSNTLIRNAYYRYIDIPYTTTCKVVLANGSVSAAFSIWNQIYYKEGFSILDKYIGRYGVTYTGATGEPGGHVVTPYEKVNLLKLASGAGKLESISFALYQEAGDPWGEGNINIYLNQEATPSIKSSGTEDFFMSGFGWVGAYHTMNHGCVIRAASGYTNVYRFFLPEQINFTNGVTLEWNCGDAAQGEVTHNVEIWASVGYYLSTA